MRNILAIFVRDFGNHAVAGITVEELDNWLRALTGSPKTRMNYCANIGVLFSLARQRRIIAENPIEFTAKAKLRDNPPEVFTVNELQALLEAARAQRMMSSQCFRLAHSPDCATQRLSDLIGAKSI